MKNAATTTGARKGKPKGRKNTQETKAKKADKDAYKPQLAKAKKETFPFSSSSFLLNFNSFCSRPSQMRRINCST